MDPRKLYKIWEDFNEAFSDLAEKGEKAGPLGEVCKALSEHPDVANAMSMLEDIIDRFGEERNAREDPEASYEWVVQQYGDELELESHEEDEE